MTGTLSRRPGQVARDVAIQLSAHGSPLFGERLLAALENPRLT